MKNIKGFTLVELIIVIAIISLLATIGISTYSSVQKDGRNARRKADLRELKTALESYKAKNGEYPITATNTWLGTCTAANITGMTYTGGRTDSDTTAPVNTAYIPGLAPEFIPKLPRDPRENKTNSSSPNPNCRTNAGENCYLYRSNGTDYKLIAHCTPEGILSSSDAYFDVGRTGYAWQVASSNLSVSW